MKIYTKTGDKGETSLYSGQRVSKNDPFIKAVGNVDECNCFIGTALSFLGTEKKWQPIKDQLFHIQHALFDLGASLSTPLTKSTSQKISRTRFDQDETEKLEVWIDEMESDLPKLTTFILPGGSSAGSFLHLARSVCRRAERSVVQLKKEGEISENVLIYLNRLSDYLFVLSRYVNHISNNPEIKWEPHKHNQ